MKMQRRWHGIAVVLVLLFAAPSGRVLAAGTERGATVQAVGARTISVNGVGLPSSRQRESVVVVGAGFRPGELIGLWATMPDYAVVGLDNERLAANANGEFALDLFLAPSLPTGMHYFSARGKQSGAGGIAAFFVAPGMGPTTHAGTRLTISPNVAQQEDFVDLAASGFGAGERVAFWATLPNGAVVDVGSAVADAAGRVGFPLFLSASLPVGRHYFTAFGTATGNAAITPFVLQYGNGLDIPGAKLAATIGRAKQRSYVEIAGKGFIANETVSFWLTLPDGSVEDFGVVRANANGAVDAVFFLGESEPVGNFYLSLRGDQSGLSGFFKLRLEPGPSAPGTE